MATRQFNILVEGVDDHDLIVALLQQLKEVRPHPSLPSQRDSRKGITTYFELDPTGDIVLITTTGGWTKLSLAGPILKEAVRSGGRNLIIFDADYDQTDYQAGGPVKREAELRRLIAQHDEAPVIYLFPSPAQEGNLETLLLELIPDFHQQRALLCYDAYETCLQQFRDPTTGKQLYVAPLNKRKIYDYVNVLPLLPDERIKHQEQGGQKIFNNPQWWNLNKNIIEPLKQFLVSNIA